MCVSKHKPLKVPRQDVDVEALRQTPNTLCYWCHCVKLPQQSAVSTFKGIKNKGFFSAYIKYLKYSLQRNLIVALFLK